MYRWINDCNYIKQFWFFNDLGVKISKKTPQYNFIYVKIDINYILVLVKQAFALRPCNTSCIQCNDSMF